MIIDKERQQLNRLMSESEIEIVHAHVVWGARAFKTKDGTIEVKHKTGRFYGGGISDNYYSLWINGNKLYTTENFEEILTDFYQKFTGRSLKK